ncbi:MAG: transposase-like protein [Halioglobus sp.]
MLGFKNFFCAQITLAGIELIRMLKNDQMRCLVSLSKTPVELSYELAG